MKSRAALFSAEVPAGTLTVVSQATGPVDATGDQPASCANTIHVLGGGAGDGGTEGSQKVDVSQRANEVYRRASMILAQAELPFLVGGAFALVHYTPMVRDTKDFDIFVRPSGSRGRAGHPGGGRLQHRGALPALAGQGLRRRIFVDIIFSSGNGVALVDDEWFAHAPRAEVLGLPMALCPAEEMIWSKAFVLERERFDGADVLHLIRDRGPTWTGGGCCGASGAAGACCTPTWCCSASPTPATAGRARLGDGDAGQPAARRVRREHGGRRIRRCVRAPCCRASST